MDLDINKSALYGGTLFRGKLPDFEAHKAELKQAIYTLYEKEQNTVRSNKGGWQSSIDLHKKNTPEFKWLMKTLLHVGYQCIGHIEGPKLTDGILLGASWANINPSGAWNAPHVHMPCEWVGVFYLQTNTKPVSHNDSSGLCDGDLMFIDPQPVSPQYRSQRPIYRRFTPQAGEFFIFPGYMLHMVAPHRENEDRISIAFNFRLQQNVQHEIAMNRPE